ncbi:hypothetical protein B0H14DRAFT_3518416, partial [Mycena olivaceomarginata]
MRRSTLSSPSAGLTSILEEEPAPSMTAKRATRRLGSRHLANVAALTACPRPRPPLPRCDSPTSDSSESEGSRSGLREPGVERTATTPSPSPTAESYDRRGGAEGAGVIRCKPSRPLAIVKRAQQMSGEQEDDDAWQDDDEYYAAHAGSFITLAPPLPPSFPAPPSCESLPMSAALPSSRALRRESAIIPTASVPPQPGSPCQHPIPTRAPPPPPIVTSLRVLPL